MTVTREGTITRFRGLSTDEKPGRTIEEAAPDGISLRQDDIHEGSVFTEVDTGHRYIWRGQSWVRQEQTIDAQFAELGEIMREAVTALRTIQAATATVANAAWDTRLPTGLDN